VGFTPIRHAIAAVMNRVEAPMNMAASIWAMSDGSKGTGVSGECACWVSARVAAADFGTGEAQNS
jgi:hypothetical protein